MLDRIDYSLNGILFDEEDVLISFENYGNNEGFVGDVFNELSDNLVPTHYDDIWKHAQNIKDFINQGLEDLSTGIDDIDRIIQVGYYVYYRETLFNNFGALIQNRIIEEVNEYLDKLDEEIYEQIDLDLLSDKIEEFSETIDSGDYLRVIGEGAKALIKHLKDGLYLSK